MRTSRLSVLMTCETPASARRARRTALGDQLAHSAGEAAQADLALAQGSDGIGFRGHSGLHALDEALVLHADAAVDAPVEVPRRAHLPARIGMDVSDLADQGLRGRDRQPLHE